jgi:purine-binding chemotaxis protein CheW
MISEKKTHTELKVLLFHLLDELYGLDVSQVLGVNPMVEISRVPQAPHFVEGVIRIRGKIIPIIDLRKRFGMEGKDRDQNGYDKSTKVIIVTSGGILTGLIVDGVSKVITIPSQMIEPISPAFHHADFLKGVGKLEKQLLLFLDLEKLLSDKEMKTMARLPKDGVSNESGADEGVPKKHLSERNAPTTREPKARDPQSGSPQRRKRRLPAGCRR